MVSLLNSTTFNEVGARSGSAYIQQRPYRQVNLDRMPTMLASSKTLGCSMDVTDMSKAAVLFSFPKGTAAGPSGLRVQHLIDAAQISLPNSHQHNPEGRC